MSEKYVSVPLVLVIITTTITVFFGVAPCIIRIAAKIVENDYQHSCTMSTSNSSKI